MHKAKVYVIVSWISQKFQLLIGEVGKLVRFSPSAAVELLILLMKSVFLSSEFLEKVSIHVFDTFWKLHQFSFKKVPTIYWFACYWCSG